MTRAVIFKTKGKLDLRSITTFGLNAKPETGHPIGYFGTGLKYAIAVLSREKIPVTFWIDGKQWVIEADPSSFRGKNFTELYICSTTIGGLIKKRIKLPFTTELGKNWQLWQAFRELESNTRDELGITYVVQNPKGPESTDPVIRGETLIVVESEEFVQEYFDRDKTFLPEGLTQREGTEDIQIFDRPSNCIYYRGIRVLDLEKDERSQLTYNILRPMELTEDRTLKSKWDAEYYIAQAIARQSDSDIIKKAVTAKDGFEKKLNYSYGTPSVSFLDTIKTIGLSRVSTSAVSTYKTHRPEPVKVFQDWRVALVSHLKAANFGEAGNIISRNQDELVAILEAHIDEYPMKENTNDTRSTEVLDGME